MNHQVEIKNETTIDILGTKNLVLDFLEQMNYEEETEVSIFFCDNDFIKTLNNKYRNKDYATDVLSFPAEMPHFLGDIIISIEKADSQREKTLIEEIEMLVCHGLLHLLGFDHEKSDADYKKMMSLQEKLLNNKTKELEIKWR